MNHICSQLPNCGLVRGFHVGPINSIVVRISHLVFADDTILFCDASKDQLLSIRLAFTCFQAFTGLKVNVRSEERRVGKEC